MAKNEPKPYVVMAESSNSHGFVYDLSPEEERNRAVVRDKTLLNNANCVRLLDLTQFEGTSQLFSNIAWARLKAIKRCLYPKLPRGYEEYEEEGASRHLEFARIYLQVDKERFPIQKETILSSGESVNEEGEGVEPLEYFQCHWVFDNEIFVEEMSKYAEKLNSELSSETDFEYEYSKDLESYSTWGYMTKTLLNGRKRRMKYSCCYIIYRDGNFGEK